MKEISFEKVEKWSLGYKLLKVYTKFNHDTFFYKEVCIRGLENIPANESVLFTPNHQNSLMDALGPLFALKSQPVFLARADIFKRRSIAKLLRFLKLMPVFREKDGVNTVEKNIWIFNKSVDILKRKKQLIILPEGNHEGFRRLRALKKGFARIAFKAEAELDFKLGISIIPVGIDYANYINFRSRLLIIFGKPIKVNKYQDAYNENPNKAYNLLKNEVAKQMKTVMIHIANKEFYQTIYDVKELYSEKMRQKLQLPEYTYYNKFIADKKSIEILEKEIVDNNAKMQELKVKTEEYSQLLHKLDLRNWVIEKPRFAISGQLIRALVFIIAFPVFIYGMINNIIPYYIPVNVVNKKIKDPQFRSTFRFALATFVSFPLFYIIQIVLAIIFIKIWWIKLVYIFTLPVSGLLAFKYYIGFKKFIARMRYNRLVRRKSPAVKRIRELYAEIIGFMDNRLSNDFKK